MIGNVNKINSNKIKQISSKKKDYEYLHISYHKVYTYSMASYNEVEFLRLFATKSKELSDDTQRFFWKGSKEC